MRYRHLGEQERLSIYTWLREGLSRREIARRLKRNVGTVSRELTRNIKKHSKYDPLFAQRRYERRLSKSNSTPSIIGRNNKLVSLIEDKLVIDRWSPDTISGRLRDEVQKTVSTQTIYNFIYRERPDLKKYLKYKKGYRRRGVVETRGSIKPLRSIEDRPKSVLNRNRYGHWEIDTVVSRRGGKGGLLTITERKSRYNEIVKIKDRSAQEVLEKTIERLENHNKKKLLTITRDNGKEFASLTKVEEVLGVKCYAAHAYASHERGSNEHSNGMIRVFYPKGTDFSVISDQDVESMRNKINRKPRKILGYKTAYEKYYGVKLQFFKGVAL